MNRGRREISLNSLFQCDHRFLQGSFNTPRGPVHPENKPSGQRQNNRIKIGLWISAKRQIQNTWEIYVQDFTGESQPYEIFYNIVSLNNSIHCFTLYLGIVLSHFLAQIQKALNSSDPSYKAEH